MLSLPQTPAVHCLALTCQWRHPYARTSGPRSWGPAERLLPGSTPSNLTVATTGASGSLFLKHFLLLLENDSRVKTVNFIASDSGLRVMAEELDIRGRANLVARVLGMGIVVIGEDRPEVVAGKDVRVDHPAEGRGKEVPANGVTALFRRDRAFRTEDG